MVSFFNMSSNQEYKSLLIRGTSESSPFSRILFTLYRFLDLPIQYSILSSRSLGAPLIRLIGGTPIAPTGPSVFLLGTNIGLSPHRAILFGMALGAFAKQIYWVAAVSMNPVTPTTSALISLFNLSWNSANTLLFVNAATSVLSCTGSRSQDETRLPVQTLIGLGLYVLGIVLEWNSEIQRTRFKKNPRNKGQIYTDGLFGYARHINYTGYVFWRAGFATAAAGWGWGLFVASAFTYDFLTRGIPELDQYCSKKYGEGWAEYKNAVPYRLFPFIL
ncbi:hypothetical protein J3R30DRAFT_3522385 [Lentinula aciculospora]|uniref:Steroid 5-alpha reductase C-terminal domain-containing protein n=1 Tax=Lentinula aciculospora TaxID=153920 RepID=A0A9W9A151_9AGAR|nr:hypothetical protein J3R30DRAFT_3522385 [Lentinula aciculospora]